ncbi:hypothetical protein AABC07_38585, partial [Streptomyces sp. LNU-CPARS28]
MPTVTRTAPRDPEATAATAAADPSEATEAPGAHPATGSDGTHPATGSDGTRRPGNAAAHRPDRPRPA